MDKLNKLRSEFADLMQNAIHSFRKDEWLNEVKRIAFKKSGGDEPTPEQWVEAAREAKLQCNACRGDGIYYGAGCIENGFFRGYTGDCFRCNGKGKQDQNDFKRNRAYDNYYRRME